MDSSEDEGRTTMSSRTDKRGTDQARRRLYLPAYRVADAARYAGAAPQTVTRWHYHGGQAGPALPGRQKGRPLSYMELVEVAFIAFFRRQGVSLQRLRRARQYAAQNLNAEYPFRRVSMEDRRHARSHGLQPV